MIPKLVTVFGASGFLGRAIVGRLAKQGFRIRVAVRHPNDALFLKPLGRVGQIQTVYADVADSKLVTRSISGAGIVINCVGILYEGWGGRKFKNIQADGPGYIGKAAKKAGVKTVIHISAIGADENSRSKYARTKGEGEQALKKAFAKAIVFRPSLIFGPEGGFFNEFAKLAKIPLAPLPLIGGKTRFQPVFVEDVAEAVVTAAASPGKFEGKIFELGGPGIYTFKELLSYMLGVIQIRKKLLPIPFFMASMMGLGFQILFKFLPFAPPLTLDQVRLLKKDNVVSKDAKGFKKFGINPTPMQAVVPEFLKRFRPKGQFS